MILLSSIRRLEPKKIFNRLICSILHEKMLLFSYNNRKVKEPNVDQCFFFYKYRNYFKW